MASEITSWEELLWVYEEFDDDTEDFQYTQIAKVDDDKIFYCEINKPKAEITFQEITASLTQIPDDEIFPPWPQACATTKAPRELPPGIYIKRPQVKQYDNFVKYKVLHLLRDGLVEEAEIMEVLRSQPHPNIVGSHGCHVRRGYITGLVLDRHPYDLNGFLKSGQTIQDKEAHNDLNPSNVLVAEDGRPILIDFGSSRRIGERLSTSRVPSIDCEIKDYTTSETHHDTFALDKICNWLSNPTFED
ncbi:kinase-like domain-containing protein [Trichoderma camerunense]